MQKKKKNKKIKVPIGFQHEIYVKFEENFWRRL